MVLCSSDITHGLLSGRWDLGKQDRTCAILPVADLETRTSILDSYFTGWKGYGHCTVMDAATSPDRLGSQHTALSLLLCIYT